MALIEVNHQALHAMARAIDTYCEQQDKQMHAADSAVKDMLSSQWNGPDATEFGKSWEDVDSSGSMTVTFREALKKYSDALDACASIYRKTQEDIYNLSCTLPRY